MSEITQTMKLRIHVNNEQEALFLALTQKYAEACTYISRYVFDHGFIMNFMPLQEDLYRIIRSEFGLKSQTTISALKTVTARYKTIQEQLKKKPFKYCDDNGKTQYINRTLDWLMKPVVFRRPQADLVRNRDYSFVVDKKTGECLLSLNTLNDRIRVSYDLPKNFQKYFDGTWSFGTGKIVSLKGNWYFHIPMTKDASEFDPDEAVHVVGIDRGLRFIASTYDEKGKVDFINGKVIMRKRDKFAKVRAELQSKGTKSAKRKLKELSGRENRWMTDVNHRISKTLVQKYGSNTLFVVEDLTGVSFSEESLFSRSSKQRQSLRTWTFYQLEQFLTYKANAVGSCVIKVAPDYTSQRCPKCGRIHKENRHHDTHEYICDRCGYRSNDDRIGAMNIQFLGTMYISGDDNPKFVVRKKKKAKTK